MRALRCAAVLAGFLCHPSCERSERPSGSGFPGAALSAAGARAAGFLSLSILLSVLFAAPQPAFGQTADTLISNTGKDRSAPFPRSWDAAQAFRTGTNTLGYTLTSVDIQFDGSGSKPAYKVEIWTVQNSKPGTKVVELTNPDTFGGGKGISARPAEEPY